jgi:hypothetical protein
MKPKEPNYYSSKQILNPNFQHTFWEAVKSSRTSLGPSQPPNQWLPGFLLGGKAGRHVDYWPPSGAKVKNAWSYNPHSAFTAGTGTISTFVCVCVCVWGRGALKRMKMAMKNDDESKKCT